MNNDESSARNRTSSDLSGKDAPMLQAVTGYFFPTRSKSDDSIPVRGYRRQRLDMTRRAMRDYGHLLDQDTRSRVNVEITDAERWRID
ncbi:MAG: hypothetical protein ABWZ27_03300 [Aestuariivirgaceae bacterium]